MDSRGFEYIEKRAVASGRHILATTMRIDAYEVLNLQPPDLHKTLNPNICSLTLNYVIPTNELFEGATTSDMIPPSMWFLLNNTGIIFTTKLLFPN